jgi:hypothetical protein
MMILEPPELYARHPEVFSAGNFCTPDGSWEKLLACNRCHSTRVRFLGDPARRPSRVLPCGHFDFNVRVFFGCDDCGAVFTISFEPTERGIWLGCNWAEPLVGDEGDEEGAADERL